MTPTATGVAAGVRAIPLPGLFALLSMAAICVSRSVLDDGDTYTHWAAGAWMLSHGAVLHADPFTETFAGQPWTAHEWLSEVMLGWAGREGGRTGLVLMTATAVAIAFYNLARHVGARCGWLPTLGLLSAAFVCVAPNVLARPHVLALPVLELWVAGLLRARDGGRAPPNAALPLMTAWANMHGGFAFGLVIAAVFAAESTACDGWRASRRWWLFAAASAGMACLSPFGVDGLLFPLRLLRMQSLLSIKEWQPATLPSDIGLVLSLAGLVVLLAARRLEIGAWRAGLLAVLVEQALAHERHAALLAFVGALLLAAPVQRAWRAPAAAGGGSAPWYWSGIALTAALRVAHPIGMTDGPATPVSALAQGRLLAGAQPVLNSNQFGGYLALAGVRPFIDGRVELFGDRFVADYLAMAGPNRARFRDAMTRYGFGWAILAVDDPLVASFDGSEEWRRSFADDIAIVFVPDRRSGAVANPAEGPARATASVARAGE